MEKMASLVHETWELCRKLGAGGYLDLIELYQFNVSRSPGPSTHPLLTPHAAGFQGFLESRVRIEQQISHDLPYFNKEKYRLENEGHQNMTLTGIPVYSVPRLCQQSTRELQQQGIFVAGHMKLLHVGV